MAQKEKTEEELFEEIALLQKRILQFETLVLGTRNTTMILRPPRRGTGVSLKAPKTES